MIKMGENRYTKEPVFQEFKRTVTCLILVELGIFAKKVGQRFADFAKSFNEPTIEVGKVKKGLNLLDVHCGWPVFYRFGLLIRY
jgi:hypothetical protein